MRSNVIPLPAHAVAAPTTPPAHAAQQAQALAAHQAAENALAMALHYLRASASNIPGASRKAVQALAALSTLQNMARATASPMPTPAAATAATAAPAGVGPRVQIGGRA